MTTAVLPEIEICDIDSTWTAAVRVTRTFDQLAMAFSELLPKVSARVAELGGAVAGPPYARYHAVRAASVDVEIGAPVTLPAGLLLPLGEVEQGQVGASALPAGRVAVTTYSGPYPGLGAAWAQMDTRLESLGHHRTDAGWESYVDDPEEVPEDQLRTEIVVPIS